MGSFVVASAILWALEKLIVLPLTMFMLRRRLAGLAQPEAQSMATNGPTARVLGVGRAQGRHG